MGRVAPGRARPLRLTVAGLVTAMLLSSCGGGGGSGDQSSGKAADTGATITMWTRSATEAASRRLVDKYNATHKNQVKLTAIPTDNYQPRIAAAAGAKNLPDVFAADVIFMPQYTSKGLFLDITDRIDALPFKDHLAPSHIQLGTYEGRKYGCRTPSTCRCCSTTWNDFFAPLILISDASKFTMPVAVYSMQQRSFGAIDYGALEAGVVVMALPCLLAFLLLQRHYVRGFMTGALRG